jgi:NADH-quinone oxidoreductase subunit M
MPWLGFAFGLAAFASLGLPGFANFASEMAVFFGAFKPAPGLIASQFHLATVFALWGVVISAVYMLRAYRAIFMGEPGKDAATWADPVKSLRWPVVLLLAMLVIGGFAPRVFLSYVQPSVQALLPK